MNIFKKIFEQTLTYKLSQAIYYTYRYIKDYHYVSDTFYSDAFKKVLKKYLNIDVDSDWLGRLYGVINPLIDINGKININNMVIVLDGENTNNNDQVQYWAHKQLMLIAELFKIEKLYDYIDLEFKHVGPANADNYLLIFDIVSRKLFAKYWKKVLGHIVFYALIVLCLFIFVL